MIEFLKTLIIQFLSHLIDKNRRLLFKIVMTWNCDDNTDIKRPQSQAITGFFCLQIIL